MQVDLTSGEIHTLLESLNFSKQRVDNSTGSPADVKKANMAKLQSVELKLRNAKEMPSQPDSQ
jgi:hypothetical protein